MDTKDSQSDHFPCEDSFLACYFSCKDCKKKQIKIVFCYRPVEEVDWHKANLSAKIERREPEGWPSWTVKKTFDMNSILERKDACSQDLLA